MANVSLPCGISEKRGEPPGQGWASAGLRGVPSLPLFRLWWASSVCFGAVLSREGLSPLSLYIGYGSYPLGVMTS